MSSAIGEKMTSNREKGVGFWNRIAKSYARKPVPDEQVYQEKLARTEARLNPADTVLEIGCGTGSTAIHLAPGVERILATDLSPRMIEIAKDKAQAAGLTNVDFQAVSVAALDMAGGSCDVILAHSILHLLHDYEHTLQRLHGLLKPGGLLISTTACIGDFMPIFRYIGPLGSALGLLPPLAVFGEADLLKAFDTAGFSIEDKWQPAPKSGVFIIARA